MEKLPQSPEEWAELFDGKFGNENSILKCIALQKASELNNNVDVSTLINSAQSIYNWLISEQPIHP